MTLVGVPSGKRTKPWSGFSHSMPSREIAKQLARLAGHDRPLIAARYQHL